MKYPYKTIHTQALRAGSLVAEAILEWGLYDDGRRPMEAVRVLSSQLHDPSSPLRCGKYTCTAAGLRLRNPEGPKENEQIQPPNMPAENGEQRMSRFEHSILPAFGLSRRAFTYTTKR